MKPGDDICAAGVGGIKPRVTDQAAGIDGIDGNLIVRKEVDHFFEFVI